MRDAIKDNLALTIFVTIMFLVSVVAVLAGTFA